MTTKLKSTQKEIQKCILVHVAFSNEDIEMDLAELKSLAEAVGAKVVGSVSQNRKKPDPAFMIGTGKVEEIKALVEETGASLVIFDNQLSGRKINNLETEFGARVIDRAMLILDIFATRAKSKEGILQSELAQLKYSLPRLSGLVSTEGRFGGGVGMRGPGETKLELNRRVIEKKIADKQKELNKMKDSRSLTRSKRFRSKKKTVAIVGYTNAGKSTLMNLITKADILAKDMLFATLDTTTRSVWLGLGKEILLVDTVGFVNKLPHEFIDAFSATLEESVHGDILLHIVDVSNPLHVKQEEIVLNVLKNLGVENTPIITVYNKIDKVPNLDKVNDPNVIYISAKNNTGVDQLKARITELL